MTSFAGRVLYSVDTTSAVATAASPFSGPRYCAGSPLRENVTRLAHWAWGDLRAQWCAGLADDLTAARPLTRYAPHSRDWVAAILCAAAVDAGRNRRPSTWSRTLAGIQTMTDVPRETILARWTELCAIGLARPHELPAYWRKDA